MIVIRFQRRGKKNRPFFKIVLAEKTSPPKGKFLESLGFYDPFTKQRMVKIDRVQYWIGQGAAVSATVHNLLVHEGILKDKKVPVHGARPKKQEPESTVSPSIEKPPSSEKESSESLPVPAERFLGEGEPQPVGESKGEGNIEPSEPVKP